MRLLRIDQLYQEPLSDSVLWTRALDGRIETLEDLPGVGRNLQDHLQLPIIYRSKLDLPAPTLLTGVDDSMAIYREETFGPVLPIMAVDSLDEAIRFANESDYGLTATGWTRSRETARRLQRNPAHPSTALRSQRMTR